MRPARMNTAVSTAPVIFELRGKRVFVAGHAGMAGSAIVRRLEREGCGIISLHDSKRVFAAENICTLTPS